MSGCHDQRAGDALKTAWKMAVEQVGGIDAAAACTRVGRSQISDYGRRGCDKFPPVDVVLDLERCGEIPVVTAMLAQLQGHALMPVELHGEGDVARSMEQVAATSGQLLADTLRALADGVITDAEAHELDRGLAELIRVAQHSRGAIRTKLTPPAAVPSAA